MLIRNAQEKQSEEENNNNNNKKKCKGREQYENTENKRKK